MLIRNTAHAWNLGLNLFLATYTTGGMFIPAVAYSLMFHSLIRENKEVCIFGKYSWKWKWIYTVLSVPLSPFIVIIRYMFLYGILLILNFIHFLRPLYRYTKSSKQFYFFSVFHSLFDKEMSQSSMAAFQIERSTEASWQFVVLLTALTSEPISSNAYFSVQTFTGKSFAINQSK